MEMGNGLYYGNGNGLYYPGVSLCIWRRRSNLLALSRVLLRTYGADPTIGNLLG